MLFSPTLCEHTGPNQGDYRFVLEQSGSNILIVIGLNPSTASDLKADPTIRKTIGFAEQAGYDGFSMINLFPKRATNKHHLDEKFDSLAHQKNLDAIRSLSHRYPSANILVAFGNDINLRSYLVNCFKDIVRTIDPESKRHWLQIGELTKSGNPRHPLYAAYRLGLQPFDLDSYLSKLN